MAKGFKAPKMQSQGGMMGQLQKLQEQIQATQAQLAEETVTATAGGGAVYDHRHRRPAVPVGGDRPERSAGWRCRDAPGPAADGFQQRPG